MAASSCHEKNMNVVDGSDSSMVQNLIEFSKAYDSVEELPRKLDAEKNKHVEEMQISSSQLPDGVKSRGKTIASKDLAGDVLVKEQKTITAPSASTDTLSIGGLSLRRSERILKASKARATSRCSCHDEQKTGRAPSTSRKTSRKRRRRAPPLSREQLTEMWRLILD